jgi:hypothetical protein
VAFTEFSPQLSGEKELTLAVFVWFSLMLAVSHPYFGLPYRSSCLNINDESMIGIDLAIGGIGKERWAFAGCCPLAGWVRM